MAVLAGIAALLAAQRRLIPIRLKYENKARRRRPCYSTARPGNAVIAFKKANWNHTESARTGRLNSLCTSARIHWCAGSLSVLLCDTRRTS